MHALAACLRRESDSSRGSCCLQITLPAAYLNASTLPNGTGTPDGLASLAVPNNTHSLFINLTQPLLPSGQLRCFVAGPPPACCSSPVCKPYRPCCMHSCVLPCPPLRMHHCPLHAGSLQMARKEAALQQGWPSKRLCGLPGPHAQVGAEQCGDVRHAGVPADAGAAQDGPQLHDAHGQRDAAGPGARLRHAADGRLLPGASAGALTIAGDLCCTSNVNGPCSILLPPHSFRVAACSCSAPCACCMHRAGKRS